MILNASLRVYFHSVFTVGIILNLEFHDLAKSMFTGIQKRIEDPIKHI